MSDLDYVLDKEEYEFSFDDETESGLPYRIEGTIKYNKDTKRYTYQYAIYTDNDVMIEKENTKGFISLQECIEDINENVPNENELLRLVYINS